MAIRLSIAFDTTPESWLNQQVQYDLRRAEQRISELRVRRLSAAWQTEDEGRKTEYGRLMSSCLRPLPGE